MHLRLKAGLLLVLMVVGTLLPPVAVGQSGGTKAGVSFVDTAAFPTVKVGLSLSGADALPVLGLGRESFKLWEDGSDRNVSLGTETVGAVFGFLVDTSGSMAAEGVEGPARSRLEQAKDLLGDVSNGLLVKLDPERRDLASLIGFGSSLTPTLSLTDDYMLLRNNIMNIPARGGTKLFDALVQSLDYFDRTPRTVRMAKTLFVFSDGDDTESTFKDINEIARRANDRGIRIHVISFGYYSNERAAGYVDKLSGRTNDWLVDAQVRSLALLTGGRYFRLNSSAKRAIPEDRTREEILQFFLAVGRSRENQTLTYTSKVNSSGKHTVKVDVGGNLVDKEFEVIVKPLGVAVVQPAAGSSLPGGRMAADSRIQVKISFPDQQARPVDRVEFTIDGSPTSLALLSSRDEADGRVMEFVWPIRDQKAGDHSLKAKAYDSLGIASESPPVSVRIAVSLPELTLEWLLANLAIVLGTIVITSVLIVTRKPLVRVASHVWADTYKTVTELFTGGGQEADRVKPSGARLRVEAGPNPGQEFPITAIHTKIGRSPELADIVLNEKTVSRQHARLEAKQNGTYVIVDDGGVNRVRVDGELVPPAGERVLRDGAIIQLGAVRLVFLAGAGAEPKGRSGTDNDTDMFKYDPRATESPDQTRPYEPGPRSGK